MDAIISATDVLHHVCYSCCHPSQASSSNPSRTATCEMCGHNGEGQLRSCFRNQYHQLKVVKETEDTMNHNLLQKVLNALVSIKEYWNGAPESAVDAIETAIERADNAELNLREWLQQHKTMNPAWSDSRKALAEIENAWFERTGASELPGGGGLLREWLAFRDAWQLARETAEPAENTSTWQCGCGNWNGVNLPNCAVCGRNRNSDQRQ